MTPQEIIKEAEELASEYIEMSDDPSRIVAGVLAAKIVKLMDYIEFLEKLNEHTYR